LFRRAREMGFELEGYRKEGSLFITQVDTAELSPGAFTHAVRVLVDTEAVSSVAIDSLNGYQASMPEEQSLILHMHELLQYLNRQGATTFLTVAQHGLVGEMKAPVDVTYLADTVILLRYFEAAGRVRRAISIIKKRTSAHEDPFASFASPIAASWSATRWRLFKACWAASRSTPAEAHLCWETKRCDGFSTNEL
jgi:circadian clock protein KaiC